MQVQPSLRRYTWIVAAITVFFAISSFGNGANDVSNSYANAVASRTLTMPQVGIIAIFTEFIGAVALGARVTNTIKNGILDSVFFARKPAQFMVAMFAAELGSSVWLVFATKKGFPVSTTQTVVGAIIGSGLACGAPVRWGWAKGSFGQIAASWVVSPVIAAVISAALFATLKYGVLERADPLRNALRVLPVYLAFTASVLALFLVVECPTFRSLEELGARRAVGIVLGTLFGTLGLAYVFLMPYFRRRVLLKDSRVNWYHIPLGLYLLKPNPQLYWPAPADQPVTIDYYTSTKQSSPSESDANDNESQTKEKLSTKPILTPEERFLQPTTHLHLLNPRRLLSFLKYILLQGVTRDVIHHTSAQVASAHAQTIQYDNSVEYLFTFSQVASCMIMSIAHGSNDVSNAVGPWVAVYNTWLTGSSTSAASAPTWILVAAGVLLGLGFWFFGYNIMRAMGNHVTQLSPVRGYCVELGTAITVLLASRLALPISTTQTLTGALVGVGMMNGSWRAVNWRQIGKIFCGWCLTLPCAGVLAFLVCSAMLRSPQL